MPVARRQVPTAAAAPSIGRYRIVHHGDWKYGWTGEITAFTGATRPFLVS